MIDQNREGVIDKEDVHAMPASLGKNPADEHLDAVINEAPGPMHFTMFLTVCGEKFNGTDPEDVLKNAFPCFDEEATGPIWGGDLRATDSSGRPGYRKWMSCTEQCLTKREISVHVPPSPRSKRQR